MKWANIKLGQFRKLEWKSVLLKKLIAERKRPTSLRYKLPNLLSLPNVQSYTKNTALEKHGSVRAMETKTRNKTGRGEEEIFI